MNVSVVIPSYKSEKLISRTIHSVINAGVAPNNIYVIEDGIFDNTRKKIEDISGINHISYSKNKGAPYARNLGLDRVNTSYVMFIDSDDFVSTQLIKGLVDSSNLHNADISFGPWRLDGDSMRKGEIRQPPYLDSEDWIFNWINNECVPTCSVLWRTEKLKKIGGWDERLKKNQDGELAIRGLINTKNISISQEGYSTYWQHNSQLRVSKAPIEDRLFASEVVYEHILNWINSNNNLVEYKKSLGRYCCKVAWIAQSEEYENDSDKWISRAKRLGYENDGYNKKTILLSRVFGFDTAIKIKSELRTLTSYLK
ncbi:Glycosyltransferase involved in cell wall bisynthesis [Psychrobacter pacificensis]|uniref:Glycosyl transferase n=1 Tax=Psychrobacter pacificensis TaxID=112002 RepID=A0A1G6YXV2_9GAMM|nr:glycosyltransferase family A protein [Psychrobacter pacificensis]GLR28021.1 glycosyl transferase [Psychrobacter pacificensis]SDD95082.1 Glycosyltransferase involved in cell wall bisynthesis [Psychrobacter pacificensis]